MLPIKSSGIGDVEIGDLEGKLGLLVGGVLALHELSDGILLVAVGYPGFL